MRIYILAIILLLSGQACLRAQTRKTDVFLKPEDFGMHKFVWELTPQSGEIVVFYQEMWWQDKLIVKQEVMRGVEWEGIPCTLEVLFADRDYCHYLDTGRVNESFPFLIKSPGRSGREEGYRLQSLSPALSEYNPHSVRLTLVSEKDSRNTKRFVYAAYTVPYTTLKERYPGLPPLEELRTMSWAEPTAP